MNGPGQYGVRIVGAGSAAPARVLTNHELEETMDTSHEWIVQRTGIHERRICSDGECELTLASDALQRALDSAGMEASELDMIVHASVTSEMTCPSNACRIADRLGAGTVGAFDLTAACSGMVYGMNLADSMLRLGRAEKVGVIGCDALSYVSDFTERTVSILFGDGAGAMVLARDEDPGLGCIFQELGSDGSRWDSLYMPRRAEEVPEWDRENPIRLGCLRMTGRDVFRFAVGKFREVMQQAMDATGLGVDDFDHFVCHQSNQRILDAAIEKLGLPPEKVRINIDKYGNTSAGSVGLVFDELWREGLIDRGQTILFVAFGGGMTWASAVWRT